jgi:hypothetical protein
LNKLTFEVVAALVVDVEKTHLSVVNTFAQVVPQQKYQYVDQSDNHTQLSLLLDKLLAVFAAVTDVLKTHLSVIFLFVDQLVTHQPIYQYKLPSDNANKSVATVLKLLAVLLANSQVENVQRSVLAVLALEYHQQTYP